MSGCTHYVSIPTAYDELDVYCENKIVDHQTEHRATIEARAYETETSIKAIELAITWGHG